jgi:hypothetical protein
MAKDGGDFERVVMGHRFRILCLLICFAGVIPRFCAASSRDEPLVVVQDGKYGYIDHEGKIVIRPQFIWAEDFWRGLGTVYLCGSYVSIDSSGALFPLRIAVEGQLEARKSGERFGFVDASGQFRIAPTFEEVLPFSEGFAAVRSGDKWGFIDTSGHLVIQPQFKAAYYFRQGVAEVELDSGYLLIDTAGKIHAKGFQFADTITEGRVPVYRGEKSGYLDLEGKIVIPFVYDGVSRFSDGLAAVRKGEKWGYVDRNGRVVIPLQFDRAGEFSSGLAPAKLGDKSGFVDRSGKFAFSLEFDYAPGFLTGDEESDLFIAPTDVSRFWTADQKFGYVNTSGRVIWGPIDGSPDHPPLAGWSEDGNAASCAGVPELTKRRIAGFPEP